MLKDDVLRSTYVLLFRGVPLAIISFDRYKSKKAGAQGESAAGESKAMLAWPAGADKGKVSATAASTFLVRDLITTPCEHMGPQHLEVWSKHGVVDAGWTWLLFGFLPSFRRSANVLQ